MLSARDVFVVAAGDGCLSVLPLVLGSGENSISGESPLERCDDDDGIWKSRWPGKMADRGT